MGRRMNNAARAAVLAELEVELERVRNQSLEEDLAIIDGLYGAASLPSPASADDVKREALAQVKAHTLECINGTA